MFERVFRWNSPAEENFFALTLFFAGSWVAAALAAVLWTYIPALRDVPAAAGSILVCVTMPAAAFLYAVALYCFYSTGCGRMLHRIVFVLAVPFLAALAGLIALSGEAALAVFLACVIWAGPFLFSRRVWHWKLAAAVAWTLAALTLWQGRLFHARSVPADFRLSNIVTTGGLVCFVAGWVLTGVVLARRDGVPLRRVFGGRTALLLCLWAAAYLGFLALSLHSVRGTRILLARLERQYGHPATVEELRRMYFMDRRADREFWDKWGEQYKRMEDGFKFDVCPVNEFLGTPGGEAPAPVMAEWRNCFERNAELPKLEALFDVPLPAYPREIRRGECFRVLLPELRPIREFADHSQWRVRFAVEKRDPAEISAALRRMENAAEYLSHDVFLISMLVWCVVEDRRLDALERIIAADILSDAELRSLADRLSVSSARLPEIERRVKFGELAQYADMTGYPRPWLAGEGLVFPDRVLDVLFPPFRYCWEKSRQELFRLWRNENWLAADAPDPLSQLPMAMILAPERRIMAERFAALRVRYDALRALLGAELERRRTGKLPERLAGLPVDPFADRPLRYRVGKFEEKVPCWDAGRKAFSTATRSFTGAAVWSVGTDGGAEEKPVFDRVVRRKPPYVLIRRPVR